MYYIIILLIIVNWHICTNIFRQKKVQASSVQLPYGNVYIYWDCKDWFKRVIFGRDIFFTTTNYSHQTCPKLIPTNLSHQTCPKLVPPNLSQTFPTELVPPNSSHQTCPSEFVPTGNRSKAPDKDHPGQLSTGQKPHNNKPPRIIEEMIGKYAVDANLFRLGSTNPNKIKSSPCFFFRILHQGLIVERLLSRWLLSGGFLSGSFWPRFQTCPTKLLTQETPSHSHIPRDPTQTRQFYIVYLKDSWTPLSISRLSIAVTLQIPEIRYVRSDRSELDLCETTIRIQNFPFSRKLWWKNCWKLPKLLRYREAHSLQAMHLLGNKVST